MLFWDTQHDIEITPESRSYTTNAYLAAGFFVSGVLGGLADRSFTGTAAGIGIYLVLIMALAGIKRVNEYHHSKRPEEELLIQFEPI